MFKRRFSAYACLPKQFHISLSTLCIGVCFIDLVAFFCLLRYFVMEIIRDSVLGYPARRLFPSKFRYPEEISQACNVEGFDSTAAGPIARLSQQATEHLYVLEENSQPGHPSEISSDQDSEKLDGKTSICRWYGDDDPENPHNWSRPRKLFVVANVAACSFVVYGTAPIWTPSSEAYMSEYGTNHAYTSLGLSLFV